jgi:hypothetical protein
MPGIARVMPDGRRRIMDKKKEFQKIKILLHKKKN